MRDPNSFKRFFGSGFLSDFTLFISSEPPLVERDSNCSQGPGGSEQCLLQHTPSSGPTHQLTHGSCNSGLACVSSSSSTSSTSTAVVQSNSSTCISSDVGNTISLPVHGVVLAAASPYFETLLRDWKSSSNTLHMVVAEDQIAAAQVLLSFMYASAVPANMSQHDLLQLLLLADRFDVRRAAAAASRVLGCLSPAALEWSTLTGIWGLPDHLFEADEQEPLRVVAWDRLMQLFGDLEDSWATADGRSLWQQLPLRAVLALAASDTLAVASENTVFAALSSWIAHAQTCSSSSSSGGSGSSCQGRQLTPHDLRVLASSVRLPAMGATYLSYVAMQHDWFRQATDVMTLARAAAFAAASSEVRKDIMSHTAATTTAALAAAAAAAAAGSSGGSGQSSAADASSGSPSSRLNGCICGGTLDCSASSTSSTSSSAGGSGAGSGSGFISRCICSLGSCSPEQQAQLLALAQAAQRPRASSCQRMCSFPWHVDLAAIKQLHDEVAAAGSRDSRILRSPAHSFAGYEWALQLEITQTRGATGFDGSKPWALGVFLTCQVRAEVPSKSEQQQLPAAAAAAGGGGGAAGGTTTYCAAHTAASSGSGSSSCGGAAAGGDAGDGHSSVCISSNSARSNSTAANKAQALGALVGAAAATGGSSGQQQTSPLTMQLVDFGFVSTAATISVREVGGLKDKRCEKSWEHAVVRYRASWGWPNYLDVQCTGWDESAFERWVVDGQMHLQAVVRVLG